MSSTQTFFGLAVVIIAVLLGFLWAFQTYSIYKFRAGIEKPEEMGLNSVRVVPFLADDGTELRVWVSDPAPGLPVIISFYGNFTSIGPSVRRLAPLIKLGYGLAVMEYRGSGATSGQASEENFASDARALYDQLDRIFEMDIQARNRVIHGYSLGSSIAVQLATSRDSSGLILEASFDRLCRFQQKRLHGLPMCLLMWKERHDVVDRIGDITAPLLLGHGERDKAIPPAWAKALFDRAPEPKMIKTYKEGTHTNLFSQGFVEDMDSFIKGLK
ncbi:MAG TPA: hypothetical protein ENJ91_09555 [Rhodobacteraceae bacterium]|nr:hypothetical protein [Paracoccaceae bacterium]